jgi:hypothetical protein
VLEKFGGDTIDDVKSSLGHYRTRIATAPEAPVAGGRGSQAGTAGHGLTGTDEAGSGGDD